MGKFSFKERMSYQLDKLLSKGTGVLILALFTITAAVVLVVGVAMTLIDPEFARNPLTAVWNTFMFALDAGTLAGYSTTVLGILALFVVTLCGIFITSMLIGVLSAGLESKLDSLRKGDSRVLAQNHTVLIGFNENVFPMLGELVIANENEKKAVLVVLGETEKSEMEREIAERLPLSKTTEIICRSGAASDLTALARCSIETARSVIVSVGNDAETIKAILAVTHILNSTENSAAHITAGMNDPRNVEVAKIAGEGRAEIVYFKNAVARIIANTCHQPGLSQVYTELFDFGGDEIYIEYIKGLAGKTFGELGNLFAHSTVLGVKHGELPMLNPPSSMVLEADDALILLASDNGVSVPLPQLPDIDASQLKTIDTTTATPHPEQLLVLGYNDLLPDILAELDNYIAPGSQVTVGASALDPLARAKLERGYAHMTVHAGVCDLFDGNVLEAYIDSGFHQVIVLSSQDCDMEESDAQSLMILLRLKAICEKRGERCSVVSQMLSPTNGELARIANVNDFVISTNLTALILSQISENRDLAAIFEDILDADGSELYMKPAELYVKTGEPVRLFAASHAAMLHGEVLLGYKTVRTDEDGNAITKIITNPDKNSSVTFTSEDMLIVLSEEG